MTITDSTSKGKREIDINTLSPLFFQGEKSIINPPGEEIYSDVFSFNLKSLSEIAISIYLGLVPENLSGHKGSRTYSFIEEGNKV